MRIARVWLAATLCMAMLACAMLTVSGPTTAEANQKGAIASHWRHHDGRWSYWHQGDHRWYYTDGSNWFYNNGNAWNVYNFDKGFGKDGFERAEYKTPGVGTKVVTPSHRVYPNL